MTRDDARAHWAASGLTLDAVTNETLRSLRNRIDESLKASELIKGYRANPARKVLGPGPGDYAKITCTAYYFTKREAVTFHQCGFVAFAGWADEYNVQPILAAFCAWVDELASTTATLCE